MLKDLTIGQYVDGNSLIHRLDPRTKIVAIFIYIVALFLANSLLAFTVILLTSGILLKLTEVPLRYYLRGLKPLWIIVIFTACMQMFLTPGQVVFSRWIFSITVEGLMMAFFMCTRLVLLVVMTSAMTLTTTPTVLTNGLEALLQPLTRFRFPAHELAMMMTIALRFIPTLVDELDKIIKAQTARGADFESGNLISRAKALLPILVPIFVSALKRADELALAMEARAYHGGEGRTHLYELHFQQKDFLALGVMLIFLLIILLMRYFLKGAW